MKKRTALLVLLVVLTLPTISSAQENWVAENIYALNTNLGVGLGIDYNMTSRILQVVLLYTPPEMIYGPDTNVTFNNVGLAILEIVFGHQSIPTDIKAYIQIGDSDRWQDQLINWSIAPVTWTFPNMTEVSAYYAYAYIYLFENQSIYSPTPQRPYFENDLLGLIAPSGSAYVLSSSSDTVLASAADALVHVDCTFDTDTDMTLIIGITVVMIVAVIFVIYGQGKEFNWSRMGHSQRSWPQTSLTTPTMMIEFDVLRSLNGTVIE